MLQTKLRDGAKSSLKDAGIEEESIVEFEVSEFCLRPAAQAVLLPSVLPSEHT